MTRPGSKLERQARSWSRAMGTPRLDWTPHHDPCSRLFAAYDAPVPKAAAGELPKTQRLWSPPVGPLNQGSEGACVGAACATLVNTGGPDVLPASPQLTMDAARDWYRVAQALDQHPGNSYVGTSGLGGAKVGKERGYWSGYRWCFSVAELAAAVVALGPAVVCIPWHAGMYRLGANEPLRVAGPRVGGHALAVIGWQLHPAWGWCFVVLNSWGYGWGDAGRALVPVDVMAALLAQNGEAFVPVGRPATAPAWRVVTS